MQRAPSVVRDRLGWWKKNVGAVESLHIKIIFICHRCEPIHPKKSTSRPSNFQVSTECWQMKSKEICFNKKKANEKTWQNLPPVSFLGVWKKKQSENCQKMTKKLSITSQCHVALPPFSSPCLSSVCMQNESSNEIKIGKVFRFRLSINLGENEKLCLFREFSSYTSLLLLPLPPCQPGCKTSR